MKKLGGDFKKGSVKLKVESLDDLWYLSQIIDIGDLVSGTTERKVKLGGEGDRSAKTQRKIIFLEIEVEKVELTDNSLRVNGKVIEGTDDVSSGSYHTFDLGLNDHTLTLKKTKWLTYQINKIKESITSISTKILIVVMDRENAIFALNHKSNYKTLATLNGDVVKKVDGINTKNNFYSEVEKIISEYTNQVKPQHIIVASPAFFKDDFMKSLKSKDLKKLITLATCSSVTNNAITEVLQRKEVQHVLQQDLISKETKLVEDLMQRISKDDLAVYGIEDVKKAADMGAVLILLVSDMKIKETREKGTYDVLEKVMSSVDSSKGEVHLISSTHEFGKQLHGLGGVAAILRFSV